MLSTTRNVIAAVLLLAALSLMSPAAGDIHAYSSDGGRRNFDGLSALFGGVPPADGLKAFLVDARLENTCEPMAPPPPGRGGKLIVLMAHSGGCSHAAQVLNAQRAGYGAAIVHAIDSTSGGLTRMGLTWEVSVWMQIHIPSVSVSEETADSLKRNYTDDKGGHVVLMPDASQNSAAIVGEIVTFLGGLGTGIGAVGCFATALAQRSRLSLVASLMSLLGVLAVLGLLFWFPVLFTMWLSVILWYAGLESWLKLSQTRRITLDERLLTLLMFIIIMAWSVCVPALGWLLLLVSVAFFVSVLYLVIFVLLRTHLALRADARTIKELRKKQIHEYKTDDPYDMCSICLEEYQEGEELRVLPCSHAYHSVCLEPWLSDMMKTTCPLCGQDVANREAETGAAFP